MLDAYRGAASLIETKPDEAKGKFLEAWSLWRPNGAALMQAGLIAERVATLAALVQLPEAALLRFP